MKPLKDDSVKKKNNLNKLYAISKKWISELEFILIEHHFIKELILSHFVDICQENLTSEANAQYKELEDLTKKINLLKFEIHSHEKKISVLFENDSLNNEILIRESHKLLVLKFEQINERNKLIKSLVFEMIKDIMKHYKQKKLLAHSVIQSKVDSL